MSVLSRDAEVAVRWSDAERARALKRIVPKAAIGSCGRPVADAPRAAGCRGGSWSGS